MRPDNNCPIWELVCQGRDEFLELIEQGLFVKPQPVCEFPAHTSGGLTEPRGFTDSFGRHEQILMGIKGIDMIKIGIDENKITIAVSQLFDFFSVKAAHLGSQHVTTR